MENVVIIPWDTEERSDLSIPEYIENMAQDVLKNYDFTVKSMDVVTTKPDKGGAIWKLITSSGPVSLKLLHRRPARSLFSLGAQNYLTEEKGARIPKIIKTTEKLNFVLAGGKLWFVAEWIEPLDQVSKDLTGAKELCRALGEFHQLSKGYIPPKNSEIASRLHKWPMKYEKIIRKIGWFRNIAKFYPEKPASEHILKVVDSFEEQAVKSLKALNNSAYLELVKGGISEWGLVHQDYGWSNGQMGPNGMWIIDLDGVAFDLPIRDLTKLITGTMADLFEWDVHLAKEMIRAYHETYPLSKEMYEMLLIDLSLPNEFYKNIKEVVYEPEEFLNEETSQLIQKIVETDESKWPALEELQNYWEELQLT